MYIPAHFQFTDPQLQAQLIHSYPLASLITPGPQGPIIDPVPLLLQSDAAEPAAPQWYLRGHIARVNPAWQHWGGADQADAAVVAIFHGPDCYISPNWYASKALDHRVVPTWNYLQVHVYGRARAVQDADWLRRQLAALTDQAESDQAKPWRITDAAPEYVEQLLRAVVGVEILVERVEAKAKLSQNQSAANYASACAALAAGQPRQLAVLEWMRRLRPE